MHRAVSHDHRPAGRRAFRRHHLIASLAAIAAGLLLTISLRPPIVQPAQPLLATAPTQPDTQGTITAAPPLLERTTAATEPAATYADYVDRLVEIGLATSSAANAHDDTAAQRSDDRARTVFAELLQRIDDADEQALAAYAAAPPPPATPEQQLRAQIHLLVIDAGLQRRHAEFTATRDRGHLDALVAAVLGVLPQQEAFAEPLGRARLAGRPFLGAGHEAAVLALVALAGEHGFPLPVATELLRTLWHNLEQQGVRSSGELTSLALLLLQDQNPAKRLCACTELLRSERYRPLVLELARAGKDESFATDVALAAAQTLPPETALASLQELLPSSSRLLAAFLTIGNRDATAMRSAYERRLADDTDPGFRAELITGAGFTRTPEGLALARLAFDSDPHLEVRTRAMFALTANAAESLGETAIHTLLDLPEFARDPARLGAAVLALENLERKGQINAIDRLGQRLRTCSALLAGDRANLERILARSLPGGRTSR